MTRTDYLFYEPPVGYAVFKVVYQTDTVGFNLKEVQDSVADLSRFGKMVELVNYTPTPGTPDITAYVKSLANGELPEMVKSVLELSLPQTSGKKSKVVLGVADRTLAVAIKNAFPGMSCETTDTSVVVAMLFRGLRTHYTKLIPDLNLHDMEIVTLVTGTAFSRAKIRYSSRRDDRFIVSAVTSLDSLDKGMNLFGTRIRVWYDSHFPELFHIVREALPYVRLVLAIRDRNTLDDSQVHRLADYVNEDEGVARSIIRAARTSVGFDLLPEDFDNIGKLATAFLAHAETRRSTAQYLENKLRLVAPNLQTILGTVLTARLIAQAGSLKELSKKPASTLQILGAEKALFRALKTKGNTPKYGILFHSGFITKTAAKNKGRIARYLANKCAMAARIDCYRDDRTTKFGEALRSQIEGRLEFLQTGKKQPKNSEIMDQVKEFLGDAASDIENESDDEMDVDVVKTSEMPIRQAKEVEKMAAIVSEEDRKARKEEKKARKEEKKAKKEEKKARKAEKKAKEGLEADAMDVDTTEEVKEKKKKRKSLVENGVKEGQAEVKKMKK